jgi:capsular exopolysaccharide synthesis family protein
MDSNEQFGLTSRGNFPQTPTYGPTGQGWGAAPSESFSWEQAVRVLAKNALFIAVVVGTLTLAVALFALLTKNVYQPRARLEIDPFDSGVKTLHEVEDSRVSEDLDYLETQVQILHSDALAMNVIRALHLDTSPVFMEGKKPGKATESAASEAVPPVPDSQFLRDQLSLVNRTPQESVALGIFQKQLSVSPVRNSRLVEVSFSSHDARMSQLITNTLVTQFIDQSYRDRYSSTMEASEWLSKQLDGLHQKVEEANQNVADFQKQYGFVEVDDKDVPLAQLMNEVNHQLSDAQASRVEAEAYVRMVDQGKPDAIPSLRDDVLYQNLMTRYADSRTALAQARTIYGDENSNVKKLLGESAELDAQIQAERDRVVGRVRSTFSAAHSREQMMLGVREKLNAKMVDESSHMATYLGLKNEAQASAELYNTLQSRLHEAGIYAGLKSSNIRVVDLAPQLRQATGPDRKVIVAVGSILSCMFGLALAFVREGFDNTVRTPDDIKTATGLTSLAMLPKVSVQGELGNPINGQLRNNRNSNPMTLIAESSRFQGLQPHTEGAEAVRNLRTALCYSHAGVLPQVTLVTSPSAKEGKTTVSINLATALAQIGKTCLLEGDLRKPTLAQTFQLPTNIGLVQVLDGDISYERAFFRVPNVPDLYVMPAGALVSNPADNLSLEVMRTLVASLRKEFEFIVIDSPPDIPFSDARILSILVDAVILVSRYGQTTRRAIARGAQLLDEVGAPVVGVVLNDIDMNSADYHFYNYGFSRSTRANQQHYTDLELKPVIAPATKGRGRGAHA